MKRRDFLKVSAVAGAGIFSPWNTMALLNNEQAVISDEEKNKLLHKYFSNNFHSSIESNIISPNNRYLFADSFEVILNKEKNTIFDFTDEIIELGQHLDEDWSCLKKGIKPDNLELGNGSLGITKDDGKYHIIKFDKLVRHDATLRLHNYIQILSYSPPSQWNKVKKLNATETELYTILNGELNGELFKIWKNDVEERKLNIEQFQPSLKVKEKQDIDFHQLKILKKFIDLEKVQIGFK